jgi:hypothetical protein
LPINQCNARPQATNRNTKMGTLAPASAERNCNMTEIRKRRTGCEPAQIDLAELEELAGIQCTAQEMAARFKVSIETLQKPEFAAVIERGRAQGRAWLRDALINLRESRRARRAMRPPSKQRFLAAIAASGSDCR